MVDYTNSKDAYGLYPDPDSVEAAGYNRYGPLLTGKQIRSKFLKGIPLKSGETGEEWTDEDIEDLVDDAVAELEAETKLELLTTRHGERVPFDRNLYQSMGYFRLKHKPVTSVDALEVVTSNDQVLWEVSIDWVDTGYLTEGLIYIVPINVAAAPSAQNGGAAGGAAFLAILGQQAWVAAFWRIRYTTGFKDLKLPKAINLMIGIQTAMNTLRGVAATYAKQNSKSLSIDGLSQSNGHGGPAIYDRALEELQKRKDILVGRAKAQYGTKFIVGEL